jgi:protein phosphatase
MVADEEITTTIAEADTLEQATKALVKAANRAGGEDNITVVLFSLTGEPEPLEDTAVAASNGRGDSDLEDTISGLEAPTLTAAVPAAVLEREREVEPWGAPEDAEAPAPRPRPRPRWRRRLIWSLLALVFVAGVVAAAFWALSRANFIGADESGYVVVYQGVPWSLGGGVDLFRPRYVSRLRVVQLSEAEREQLFDHDLVSYDDARARLAPYEREGVP